MIASRKTILGTAAMFGAGAAIGRVLESVRRPAAPVRAMPAVPTTPAQPVTVPVVHVKKDAPAAAKSSKSELTPEEVNDIRRRYAAGGITQRELGSIYKVHPSSISYIVRGLSYRDLDGPISEKIVKRERSTILTNDQIVVIRHMYASGQYSQKELGKRFGVNQTYISAIVRGELVPQAGGPITRKEDCDKGGRGRALSVEQVLDIRTSPESSVELANRLGVDTSTVRRVRSGKTYRDVA